MFTSAPIPNEKMRERRWLSYFALRSRPDCVFQLSEAVREKDEDEWAIWLFSDRTFNAGLETVGDRGAANWFEAVDEFVRAFAVVGIGRDKAS